MTAIGSNRTLGDLPGAYKLHFNCTNSPDCYFNKPMDVDRMIDHLGQGFASADLYNVLKCPVCKSNKFLVMFSPVHVSYGNLN
jgi:hypothetical protein